MVEQQQQQRQEQDHVLRCNICDKMIDRTVIEVHIASRTHSIMKKVAEYNEMNALIGRSYSQDSSVVKFWWRDVINSHHIAATSTNAVAGWTSLSVAKSQTAAPSSSASGIVALDG
jgi:hypothetical protein